MWKTILQAAGMLGAESGETFTRAEIIATARRIDASHHEMAYSALFQDDGARGTNGGNQSGRQGLPPYRAWPIRLDFGNGATKGSRRPDGHDATTTME